MTSGYTRREAPVPSRRQSSEAHAERRDRQLLLVVGLLGIAVLLVFMLLRQGEPATDSPSTGSPAQPTATQQDPGGDWRDSAVFDDREWGIEQSGAVVFRPAGGGGPWRSLDVGLGWEAFLVEDQTLYAVKNQERSRVTLARLTGAPSVRPDEDAGVDSGGSQGLPSVTGPGREVAGG